MQHLWILQVNLEQLSLALWVEQIQQGQCPAEGTWQLSRFREHIQPGDLLWFWQSGKGLVAQGKCLTAAYRSHEDPEFKWEIAYRLTHQCTPALPRAFFQTQAFATQISFFKRPQGNIFKVPQVHTQELLAIAHPYFQNIPTPSSSFWPEIAQKIHKAGLTIEDRTLRQYHMALSSHSLVILTGRSGVGKSWLTQAYAQATESAYLLVPVAPNWMGPEDFLGYYNAVSHRFMPTVSSQFIAQAAQEWHQARQEQRSPRAYHLVLDEMNLARTESYFAPLLSLLEVRRRGEQTFYQRLGAEDLEIPPNLFCIGTANAEDQPLHFSERIADRAFIITLTPPDIRLEDFFENTIIAVLQNFWQPLNQCFHLSYRTLTDIQTYLRQAQIHQVALSEALDEVLAQKVFHRLSTVPSHMLDELKQALPTSFRLSHLALAQQQQGHFSFYAES